MSTQRFASFHDFYPYYLREHSSHFVEALGEGKLEEAGEFSRLLESEREALLTQLDSLLVDA